MMASSLPSSEPYTLQPDPSWSAPNPLEAQLSTLALRHYLFAISQYCRSVWDVSIDAVLAATPFHSYEEPAICLSDYIVNIGRRLRVRRFTVLLAAVYVGRIAKRTNRPPSIMSIHRLYASSLLYACKVLDDHPPTEAVFAHAAGFPVCEVSEQQKILHSILGPDASDYNDDVEEALHHLEVASQLTLRSDITAAVAKAFRVAPPQLEKEDAWFEPCSTPVSIIALERIPSHLAFGSSMHSSSGSGSSTDSQYVVFGSGASAVRGLRSNRSLSSSLLTPHDEKPMLSFAMPTFGLPSFTARFPSSLHSHSDTAVTPSAPSLKIASTTAHSPTDDSHVKNMLPPSRFP